MLFAKLVRAASFIIVLKISAPKGLALKA